MRRGQVVPNALLLERESKGLQGDNCNIPDVAAACAHASLASLSKDSSNEGITNSNNKGPSSQHDAEDVLLSAEKVRAAAKDGLVAAAMKAKLFADHEEREIQRLSTNIINNQDKSS